MSRPVPDREAVARTEQLMCDARRVLAYGGLDGVVQRPLYDDEGGLFPQFAVAAQGYELTDSTGQTYVDWVNGWGPVFLGYRHPEVEEAVRAQLAAGPTLSLMHPLEVEVARTLTEMIPCAEMVAFGKNGSDAVTAAVRIARAVSGREIILQHGFHGYHDWYTCQFTDVRGIPTVLRPLVHPFPYNDLPALEALFRRFEGKVAGIVMEPMNVRFPEPGYLEGVRDLAHEHGALLVFDEMVTAFRLANGGAQELLGVVPDLTCIGKALANGMPLSALVGKREYMQYLSSVGYGMTFRGETLSLAAAHAVLSVLQREPVAQRLAETGTKLRAAFERVCAAHGVRCELLGPPARLTMAFEADGGLSWDSLRWLFLQECLKRGVMSNGNLLVSYAHDDAAVERSERAFDGAMAVVAEAIRAGRLRESRPHGGSPFGPRALISTGFIDYLGEENGRLRVEGWMMLEGGCPDAVDFASLDGVRSMQAERVDRPDLAQGFPNLPWARQAGYRALLPAAMYARDGEWEFTLIARRDTRVAFRCRVLRRARRDPGAKEGPYWTGDGVLYI